MEPDLIGQEKSAADSAQAATQANPQWSLTSSVRKRISAQGNPQGTEDPAMEPDLIGQEKGEQFATVTVRITPPQWSLTSSVRKRIGY